MKKKKLVFLLVLGMGIGLCSGCTNQDTKPRNGTYTQDTENTETENNQVESGSEEEKKEQTADTEEVGEIETGTFDDSDFE